MTREEAIEILKDAESHVLNARLSEALKIAIETLNERLLLDHETMKADFEEIKLRGVDKLEGD